MKPRVAIGEKILGLGDFVKSLAVAVMRPRDLIEFSRRTYAQENNVAGWASPDVILSGLNLDERDLLQKIPCHGGRLLLLGVGGGREAIPLARSGFAVTGLDFIPEMVERAKENARDSSVAMEGLVQELSRLELRPEAYEVVWLSAAMYSCVPTRKRRMAMLKKIHRALAPGGFFICQFHWRDNSSPAPLARILQKTIAVLSLGNTRLEKGDQLWFNREFIHAFHSEAELKEEFAAGGFEVVYFSRPVGQRGGAVLKKPDLRT